MGSRYHYCQPRQSYHCHASWLLLLFAVVPILSRTIVETIGAPGNVIEDGPYGGNGGDPWTDGGEVHLNGDISSVEVRTGSEVDSIRVKYGDVYGENHGGGGGSVHSFDLSPGAKITIVQGRSGGRVDELEMITDDGVVFGPYGGNGGDPFVAIHPGCYLSYLSGSAGGKLDSITLHWECP